MHLIYDRWPEIAKESFESNYEPIDSYKIDHVVFAGMGGSGAIGDVFFSILSKTNIHACVVKGYHLPRTVDPDTLVIATSISGNTTETLSILKSAVKLGTKVIVFSSGGNMERYCLKNQIEHRNIPMHHSPRASFTCFLYSILKVLNPILPIRKTDVLESIAYLEKTKKNIWSANLGEDNLSISLARWIKGIPLVYYPWGLQAAAIRFKNSLQENAKTHVIAEDVIEACHNGVVSWERPSAVQPILIQGIDDYTKTKERWKILKEFFESKQIEYQEIFSVRGGILSKLINLIYLLDYTSVYLAVLSKVDPTPVSSIDFFKQRI